MVRVENLAKEYKNFKLDDISFELPKGKITALIGPNGAGKSTIIKILSGLRKPDSGKIFIENEHIGNIANSLQMGYLSQDLAIYQDIYMNDLVGYVKKAYKKAWNQKKYDNYCVKQFGLTNNLKVKELSTGMRVKFFLSIELAKEPVFLILDEPTSGLDPVVRDEVLDILVKLKDEDGVTIFFSSHITEDIEKIGDKVIFINNGKLLVAGDKTDIIKEYVQISREQYQSLKECEKESVDMCAVKVHDYFVCNKKDIICGFPANDARLSDILYYLKEKEK